MGGRKEPPLLIEREEKSMDIKDMKEPGAVIGGGFLIAALQRAFADKYPDATRVVSDTSDGITQLGNDLLNLGASITDYVQLGLECSLGLGLIYSGIKINQVINEPEKSVFQISPSKDQNIDPSKLENLVKGFYYIKNNWINHMKFGRSWMRYLIMKDQKGKISFYLIVPKMKGNRVEAQLRDTFPFATVREEKEFDGVPFFEVGKGHVGFMKLIRDDGYGLNNRLENNMGSILNQMPKGSVIDIRFSPTDSKELKKSGRKLIKSINRKSREATMDKNEITDRMRGHKAFDVSIILWSKYKSVVDLADQIKQHTSGPNNSLKLMKYWYLPDVLKNPLRYDFTAPPFWTKDTWNDTELSQLFMTPQIDHHTMEQIEVVVSKLKPKSHELNQGVTIAYADHQDLLTRDENGQIIPEQSRPVKLRWETLDRHGLIVGKTGSGKGGIDASMMDEILLNWVKNPSHAAGFTSCDPHLVGLLVKINRLQALEDQGQKVNWDKVRCYSFDPANQYPTPLNLLHFGNHKGSYSMKAEEAANIIMSAFPGELTKSEVVLKSALEALLWAGDEHTIGDVKRLFRNEDFLESVIDKIQNVEIKEELMKELEEKKKNSRSTNLDALVTRLFPFIGHQDMQRSFCQSDNVIDGKRIIENGEIVLINFKSAPAAAFKLATGWLCNHYLNTFLGREPYSGRHHYLQIDEAQEFKGLKAIPQIIQQTRKFRGGIWLMTQDYDEMDKEITKSLKKNCGFFIALRQNEINSDQLELMNYRFKADDIKDFKPNTGALYSEDGACNIAYRPPAFIWEGVRTKEGSKESKLAYKRAEEKFNELVQRDCRHRDEVDEEIRMKAQSQQVRKRGALKALI